MSEENRNLQNYLTGLRKPFADHNGEHPNAVFVMQSLGVLALPSDGTAQSASVSFCGFHSEEYFEAEKRPLDGGNFSFNFPNREISFAELQAKFPLRFLIVADLARRIAQTTATGYDKDGVPEYFFNDAEAVELPEWTNAPEIQQILQGIEQVETAVAAMMAKQLEGGKQ